MTVIFILLSGGYLNGAMLSRRSTVLSSPSSVYMIAPRGTSEPLPLAERDGVTPT